ncbi:MAG: SemiSWEET transporter [Bacteroidota bacterium]
MQQLVTIIGILASICSAVSTIPQLVKIIKEKKAENISLLMMIVLLAGLSLWICYGIMKKDTIIIASNSFSVVINILLLVFSIYYKNRPLATG